MDERKRPKRPSRYPPGAGPQAAWVRWEPRPEKGLHAHRGGHCDRPLCGVPTRDGSPCRRHPPPGGERCHIHADDFGPDSPLCGARLTGGGRCRRLKVPGRPRCRFHGGLSPLGPAAASRTSGRYSRYLSSQLSERHQELLDESTLLELREEIALVSRHLGEIEERLADPGLSVQERAQLWARQERLFELRRQLNESEVRRLQVQQVLVPRTQVLALVQQMGAVLREELDPHTLARVVNRLTVLLARAGYTVQSAPADDGQGDKPPPARLPPPRDAESTGS